MKLAEKSFGSLGLAYFEVICGFVRSRARIGNICWTPARRFDWVSMENVQGFVAGSRERTEIGRPSRE
jgi:hypothetical protein